MMGQHQLHTDEEDLMLDHFKLSDGIAKRTRTVPFTGHYLMGSDTKEFDVQY